MINRKITVVRGDFYEYDDGDILTLPHYTVGETIANMIRAIYRKFKFFFYSLGITFAIIFLVRSTKYHILEELHFEDLVDAMKKDL